MILLNYFFYYLIIIPISLLPYPLLYLFSDFLYLIIYGLVGYRKKVVQQNLKNSFPDKSDSELKNIEKKFYRHFCDLVLETLKTFTISEKDIRQRFTYKNAELLNNYYDKGMSVVGVTAHYGNWEWGALSMGIFLKPKTMGIFHQLKSDFWDKKLRTSRGKFGLTLIPTDKVKTWLHDNKNDVVFPGFVGDQTPHKVNRCPWMTFLNQETPVFLGAEKYAREYNWPLIYGVIRKLKRGYYEIEFVLVSEKPLEEKPTAITEKHVNILEKLIIEQPEYWLWTHRRWKRSKPDDYIPYQG
ncbi:MAG: lysophospholipid acyltransferase family protein [Flavobacteriales bacterium]|nr:lysophospholipid acyltransferase family protein [Flavobacteriales bacterium]